MKIRVLVCDDHAGLRACIVTALTANPDFVVVAAVGDGGSAVKLARQLRPDVVLMDAAMPGMNGMEATRAILAQDREAHILAVTDYANPWCWRAMREAGAVGLVSKELLLKELPTATRAAALGVSFVSPLVTAASTTTAASAPSP